MKAQDIINTAEKRNLSYEINALTEPTDSGIQKFEIGVKYREWTWAWFTYYDNTDSYVRFRNTYNMAKGRNDKSRRRGNAVINQLSK